MKIWQLGGSLNYPTQIKTIQQKLTEGVKVWQTYPSWEGKSFVENYPLPSSFYEGVIRHDSCQSCFVWFCYDYILLIQIFMQVTLFYFTRFHQKTFHDLKKFKMSFAIGFIQNNCPFFICPSIHFFWSIYVGTLKSLKETV